MAQCEVCGNDYYLAFEVITAGNRHVFDCFECAIHKLAPVCAHCGCKIIGHGIEAKETFFCCANCAKRAGVEGVADHIWGKERETAKNLKGENMATEQENKAENTDDDKPHIEPSEPKDSESQTESESGDPGRTPGKAEG